MTDNFTINIKEHMFSLVRLKQECKIQPTFVDFSSPFILSTPLKSILPIYNHDSSHLSPAFILSSDQKNQNQRLRPEIKQFQDHIRQTILSLQMENHQSHTQIMDNLTPSSKYCQICKQYFNIYEDHVKQKTHILRWHHNQFNQDIQELCHFIKSEQKSKQSLKKKKIIEKQDVKIYHKSYTKNRQKMCMETSQKRKKSFCSEEGQIESSSLKFLLTI